MKNVLFLIFLFCSSIFLGQDNALLGIDFGMTKSEIKKEFNSNKEAYKTIDLGGYYWRLYYQNNTYDSKGGMTTIKLTPRGGGLFGFPEHESKILFEALIKQLTLDGYTPEGVNIKSDNYFEFKINETYAFSNSEKMKNIYIGTPVIQGYVYLNLVIGRRLEEKSTKSVF